MGVMTIDDKIAAMKKLPPGVVPCAMEEWNTRKQRIDYIKPAVECMLECNKCGWNPEVAKRRLQKMGFYGGPNAIQK